MTALILNFRFYAMRQVLKEDDEGVLVYVAPTKALVNQIAAEVHARFSKTFKHGSKSVWAIHTRDYRINSPTGCQILITVPHILQIMLLSPSNANSWSRKIRRIIFDEVHCIGQTDDGVVWEQLLMMAPCPIIALSATVGNPEAFFDWLRSTQQANGHELAMVEHKHRYSDLRKYIYTPPKQFSFNGLPPSKHLPTVGLEGIPGIAYMHPVSSIVNRSRGLPDDLTFEARDCYLLWKAMTKHQTHEYPVDGKLDPSSALPHIVRKADVIIWEADLKTLLKVWIEDRNSPFDMVLQELDQSLRANPQVDYQVSSVNSGGTAKQKTCVNTTMALLCSLHANGGLPALFFNYDRSACEKICKTLLDDLQDAESHWKETSLAWKTKMASWEDWKQSQAKLAKKGSKGLVEENTKNKRDFKSKERNANKADQARESAQDFESIWSTFDPTQPLDGFHFANNKKLASSEMQQHRYELEKRGVASWLLDALSRGIGVHHAGMNRKYRQVCEMLFRKGFLCVVIATGTLALGINMPCKTVVFSEDSIYLTALNFRQAAGRAGRRGFDILGNVIFQGVPYPKACRLLSSRLPELNGHFPITTTLVLRLFTLLYDSNNSEFAKQTINSILSHPRIYLGGTESRDTVLHHLRFSIEYLRRSHLLSPNGAPLNFAGCISHLYFTENASFAFHALLKDGYFHHLCKDIDTDKDTVLLELMLVMSNLFSRLNLRTSKLEQLSDIKGKSPSIVILPSLPPRAKQVLQLHNQETLGIYKSYVKTFVQQHFPDPDCRLPLSGIACGEDSTTFKFPLPTNQPVITTSSFIALSGHGDNVESIADLCSTVRSGVFLEQAVIPYIGCYPEDVHSPLNARKFYLSRAGLHKL